MKKNNNNRIILADSAKKTQTESNTYVSDIDREEIPEYNEYYLNVSLRFRTAKIICVFLLCIFVLSSMFIFGESLTYENARYILRDLGQILSEDSSLPSDKISIENNGDSDYTIFRGSIVVSSVSGVNIYSPSGTHKLKDNTTFTSPTTISSDKYCIVYSLGAYNLSVYNTVARVYDMKFDYPIYDVAVSDQGNIAVMTQNKEYKCVVYTYDSDFRLTATYNKTSYPVAVEYSAISGDLYIATFYTLNGCYVTELESYLPKNDSPFFSVKFNETMPYDIKTTNDGNIIMAVQKGVMFIKQDGEVISKYLFNDSISGYHLTCDSATILQKDDKTLRAKIYGSNSSLIYETQIEDASDIYCFYPYIIAKGKDTLKILQGDNDPHTIDIGFGVKKIVYNDGYMFVCYSDKITPISVPKTQ